MLNSQLCSIAIHAAIVPLLFFGFTSPAVRKTIQHQIELIDPPRTRLAVRPSPSTSGGGGGQLQPLPLTKGRLPKAAVKQFVPPQITDHVPVLAIAASIVAPPDVPLPQSNLNNWGDPLAKLVNNSGGTGKGPGLGDGGPGGGIGQSGGNSYGPGGQGIGDIFAAGGGVSAPEIVFKVEPEYSEEARKAKCSGVVVLSVVVDSEGRPRNIRVSKSLGMGLDEKAVEAVAQWRFRSGRKDGKAVAVRARIEVDFRLL